MGSAISWIAFSGINKGAALQRAKLRDTSEADEYRESDFSGGESNDWFVIQANDFDFASLDHAKAHSQDCMVVACQIEEHVMASAAYGFEDGRLLWSVAHFGEDGPSYTLEIDGTPPPQLEEIRTRLSAEQDAAGGNSADVDFMFDAPVELAKSICGYQHDEDTETPFTTLVR